VHDCGECGASLTTAGALALHETMGHGTALVAPRGSPTTDDGKRLESAVARRGRAVIAGTMATGAVVLVAFLLGAGARVAYRSVVKTTASGASSQPAPASPPSSPPPPAAPSAPRAHVTPAKASPQPVATSSGATAAARQKYLAVAASYGTAMSHTGATPESPLSAHVWAEYATALRGYDSGLRAIGFPATVQPHVTALLADDAQMESIFDKLASGSDCGCIASTVFPLKAKIAGDVDRLRVALGLAPAGDASTEPGH
jgi:hypothetical protein